MMLLLIASVRPGLAEDRIDAWIQDIDTLATELPERHPDAFRNRPREEFEAELAELRSRVPALSDGDVILGMQHAVAGLGDAHTEVDWRRAVTQYYPFRLHRFSDGWFVTRTTTDYPDACGARLVAIAGHPIDEVFESVSTLISHDTEGWARFRGPDFILATEILRYLGIVEDGAVDFEFENLFIRFTLTATPITRRRASRTIFADDPESEDTPLWLRQPHVNYWTTTIEDAGIVYFRYRLCSESGEPFQATADRAVAELDRVPGARLVIDLRGNVGGSDALIYPLLESIRSRPWLEDPERLFVLIDGGTFSSAVIDTVYLRDDFGATLVGQPTGGKANHFGEVRAFVLPRHGITVVHSTKYFELEPENTGAIQPSVATEISSADWFANRDPLLAAIAGLRPPSVTSRGLSRRHAVRRAALQPRVCPY